MATHNAHDARGSLPRRDHPRGVTLIELLVVIGVIAILAAITLVAVNRSRTAADLVACRARVAQIGQGYATYAAANKDHWPNMFQGQETFAFPSRGIGSTEYSMLPYFAQGSFWALTLLGSYINDGDTAERVTCPTLYRLGQARDGFDNDMDMAPASPAFLSYRASAAMITRPNLWSPGALERDADQFRQHVRLSQLKFPAQKVIFHEAKARHDNREEWTSPNAGKVVVLFGDFHVDFRSPRDAAPPVVINWPFNAFPPGTAVPFASPEGGYLGRDY